MGRYTVKSQLPPAVAATVIAIQFATNNKTTMVFLYMYALPTLDRGAKLMPQDMQLQDPSGHVHG